MRDLAVQQQGVAGVERSEVVEVARFLCGDVSVSSQLVM